ncbi:MAG: hypothetical protein NTW09_04675 [Candidatus Omnitrophica bacterium]|nr:hypothetical protein [Candidatus Omnitrophota bacterium]
MGRVHNVELSLEDITRESNLVVMAVKVGESDVKITKPEITVLKQNDFKILEVIYNPVQEQDISKNDVIAVFEDIWSRIAEKKRGEYLMANPGKSPIHNIYPASIALEKMGNDKPYILFLNAEGHQSFPVKNAKWFKYGQTRDKMDELKKIVKAKLKDVSYAVGIVLDEEAP